jgi:hypothetical protein
MYLLELAAFEIKASADIFAMYVRREVSLSRLSTKKECEEDENTQDRQAAARGALVPKYAPYLGLAGDFPSADLHTYRAPGPCPHMRTHQDAHPGWERPSLARPRQ